MASPFSIFRKNQKVMLALLTLLAMFGFVFIPIIMRGVGGQGRVDAVVVKTSRFGNLQESDIARLRNSRQKVRMVLTELGIKAGLNPAYAEYQVEMAIGPATEEAVVDTWLKARHAEQLGMVISKDAFNEFLRLWTRNLVKPEEMEIIFRHSPPVSATKFFDLMREDLLARQLVEVFAVSLNATTPSQRWDYFNRVQCNASIETIPVAVADYVKQVKDPTDEELKKFFKENKDQLPDPESPNPGFRVPHKVALEYFKADVDQFTKDITDAEIQKQYEKNKDFYDQLFKKSSAEKPGEKEAHKDAKEAPKGTKETKAGKEPKEVKKAEKASTPAEIKKPTEPAKTESKEPAKTEPKGPDKTKDSKGSSSVGGSSPFRLTSMLETEKPGEKKTPESPAKKEQPKTKEQKPAAASAALDKTPEEPAAEMSSAMKTRIRKDIADGKILKIFAVLRKPMEAYQQEYRKYELHKIQLKAQKKSAGPPPPGPNFEKLANEHGLSAFHTGLISIWEARNRDIAMSAPAEAVDGEFLATSMANVLQSVYQPSANLRPTMSKDAHARYLFWKSDDAKEYTPKFGDRGIREEVLRAWKLIQARSLAMKAAEALAAEARKADKPFRLVFLNRPGLEIVEPPKFSWMTLESSSQRAEISSVPGVVMAGEEFMKTVFRLDPGKVGVAFNSPQTMIYVVRPSQFTPSRDVRWTEFKIDSFSKYASVGTEDQRNTFQAWLKELKTTVGFEWAAGHKPDRDRAVEREPSRPELPDEE